MRETLAETGLGGRLRDAGYRRDEEAGTGERAVEMI